MTEHDKIENFPQYALSALINGDYSGLSKEDTYNLRQWISEQPYSDYTTLAEDDEDYSEGYFSKSPQFGLACQCETIIGF